MDAGGLDSAAEAMKAGGDQANAAQGDKDYLGDGQKRVTAAPDTHQKDQLDTSLPEQLVHAMDSTVEAQALPDATVGPMVQISAPSYLRDVDFHPPKSAAELAKDKGKKPGGAVPAPGGDADPKAAAIVKAIEAANGKPVSPVPGDAAATTLKAPPAPKNGPLPPGQASMIGDVVAKLLGQAPQLATANVKAATNKITHGAPIDLSGITGPMQAMETQKTTADLRQIADVAGVTASDLDAKVDALHKDAHEKQQTGEAKIDAAGTEATNTSAKNAEKDQVTISAAKKTIVKKVDDTSDAARGEGDPSVIGRKHEEYVHAVEGKATTGKARLDDAVSSRQDDLKRIGTERSSDYSTASDLVEGAIRHYWSDQKAKQDASADPDTQEDTAQKSFEAVRAQQLWKQRTVQASDLEVAKLRNAAMAYVDTQKKALDGKVADDLQQLYVWAESHKSLLEGWWASLKSTFMAWGEHAKTDVGAWEHEKSLEARDKAAADFTALANLQDELRSKGKAAVEAELASMDATTATLYRSFLFGGATAIDVVGRQMASRIAKERVPALSKELQDEMAGSMGPADLQALAGKLNPNFNAAEIAANLRGAMAGPGTRDEKLLAALKGHTPLEMAAIRAAYDALPGNPSLDDDVSSELSGATGKEAASLLEGDQANADAAELDHAVGLVKTDFNDIQKLLRGRTPAEIADLMGAYERQTGHTLLSQLMSTMSTNDFDAVQNLIQGDNTGADAVRMKDALQDGTAVTGEADTKEFDAVIDQIRAEVKADMNAQHFTTGDEMRDWTKREFARRVAEVSARYGQVAGEKLSDALDRLRAEANDGGSATTKGDLDNIEAELTGDDTKIDSAKLEQAADDEVWMSDAEVMAILEHQVARARDEVQMDYASRLADQAKKKGDKDTLKAEATALRHEMGAEIHRRAASYLAALGDQFSSLTGSTIDAVIARMTGAEQEHAFELEQTEERNDQGGDDADSTAEATFDAHEIIAAMQGLTNDYDSLKKLLAGRSKEEMAEIRAAYLTLTGRSLDADLAEHLSGRDGFDVTQMAKGAPETPEEKLAAFEAKEAFEHSGAGGFLDDAAKGLQTIAGAVGAEDLLNSFQLTVGFDDSGSSEQLDRAKEAMAALQAARAAKDPQAEAAAEAELTLALGAGEAAVQNHRDAVDSLGNNAALVVGTVLGIVLTVASGGLAAPLAAAEVAAIAGASAVASLAVKVAIKGDAMSNEEIAKDVVNGGIGVLMALTTAGMGTLLTAAGGFLDGGMAGAEAALEQAAEREAAQLAAEAAKEKVATTFKDIVEKMIEAAPTAALHGARDGAIAGALGTLADPDAWRRGEVGSQVFGAMLSGAEQGAAVGAASAALTEGLRSERSVTPPAGAAGSTPAADAPATTPAQDAPVQDSPQHKDVTKAMEAAGTAVAEAQKGNAPGTQVADPTTEVMDPKTEVMDPKTEVADPKTEVADPKTEVMDPKTEVADPKTEVKAASPDPDDETPPTKRSPGVTEKDRLPLGPAEVEPAPTTLPGGQAPPESVEPATVPKIDPEEVVPTERKPGTGEPTPTKRSPGNEREDPVTVPKPGTDAPTSTPAVSDDAPTQPIGPPDAPSDEVPPTKRSPGVTEDDRLPAGPASVEEVPGTLPGGQAPPESVDPVTVPKVDPEEVVPTERNPEGDEPTPTKRSPGNEVEDEPPTLPRSEDEPAGGALPGDEGQPALTPAEAEAAKHTGLAKDAPPATPAELDRQIEDGHIVDMQRKASALCEKEEITGEFRGTNPDAPKRIAEGNNPKGEGIKAKSIDTYDTRLGFREQDSALIGYKDVDAPVRTPEMDEEFWKGLDDRYHQRKQEFVDLAKTMADLAKPVAEQTMDHHGLNKQVVADEFGVLREVNPDGTLGAGFTGDIDIFRLLDKNGDTITGQRYNELVEKFKALGASFQHGAHMNWDVPMNRPSEGIFNKIVGKHAPGGGEPLVIYGKDGSITRGYATDIDPATALAQARDNAAKDAAARRGSPGGHGHEGATPGTEAPAGLAPGGVDQGQTDHVGLADLPEDQVDLDDLP